MSGVDAQLIVRSERRDERFLWPDCGEVVVHSSRSPGKTSDNEDAALLLHLGERCLVLAVADGVGGHPGGELAAKAALEGMAHTLQESLPGGTSVQEALLTGLDRANQAVLELGSGGATTMAAVTVEEGRVRAYHVGDAGVLVFGGLGRIKLETIPHSPVGYGVEAGLIPAEDALGHEDLHLVSNVVGDRNMHIGISSPLELRPRDSMVLASDGLFDNLSSAEVVEALRSGPLDASVRELAGRCHERMTGGGHADDLTLIAYRPARS
jgi:serine/threonine protein phosphatase PrpC